jgi:hypothetical protein
MAESPFERLVGTWEFESLVEGGSMGFDDTTFEVSQLYADDRGVFRIYRESVTDGTAWELDFPITYRKTS